MRRCYTRRLMQGTTIERDQSALIRAFVRLLMLIVFGSFTLIALLPLADTVRGTTSWSGLFVFQAGLPICIAAAATLAFHYVLRRLTPFIDATARSQALFLDTLDPKWIDA